MVKSLYSGVTGLKTHQQKMDVIGNNIANVNTTGFKTSVVTFSDVYYQTQKTASGTTATLGGTNPRQVGYGVQMNTTTPNMTQSGFTFSDSIYDMAIDGEGFFQLMDGAGNVFYSRAGIFNVDEMGYLVDANGYHVLGVSGDSTSQPGSSEIIRITIPETEAKCSSATKLVNGTNVTISVSAPSDNTDMSVTFTNAQYPYATYANGILNIFFDMSKQYNSDVEFETAIQSAIAAGGVTLPDDVELKFEFETIPDDPDAKIASNTIEAWNYATTSASGEGYWEYTYTAKDGSTEVKNAQLAFDTDDLAQNGKKVTIAWSATNKDTTVAGPTVGTDGAITGDWTITLCPNSTSSEINSAIDKYIEAQELAGKTVPSLKCTKFIMPSEDNNRSAAITAMTAATQNPITLEGTEEGSLGVSITATEAGEYANNYKIVFAYSASYENTKAVWDENTLTITVCNDTTLDQINAMVEKAANGDAKKLLEITGMTELNDMNAAAREALFGGNPSLSLGGGADSFYTEVAKYLTTFGLTDGRKGAEQSYKDLENVTVQNDGTIIGLHSVHGYLTLGRIDIATFDNPNGLDQVGGTMFAETVASGEAKVEVAGSNGAGEVVSGALEMSNVDLSQEFTDMITTQRGYQANSRVITTSDTMLEELLSLKR
ncbi:MAG: flagellar hook-basal body complex protein [Oscillospiraceae bacterium]|nr:flagellar hook-basal body complex protein [Oscillospiraceae bacterium]